MKQTLAIVRKELNSYFSSPMALIFVGVFLAATLFVFFSWETFFARGIADVRPLFSWMPIILIFLVAALTMRQWSEEQQTGTLEILLTLPTRAIQLVMGKFIAVMGLIMVALALTFFIPITVAMLGNLDWGPVIGGYLAAILLAAAYAAIGLFISSRTDNQIVSLILTVLVAGLLYLVGTRALTDFAPQYASEILRMIGAGSRFESIERGVIDIRDLVYYLSIAGIFLTLNVLSLDSKRWGGRENTLAYRQSYSTAATLLVLNLIIVNIWLFPLSQIRLDLTQQREYSLSPVTKDLLNNIQEPLLIRGYFSQKSHRLLAPLVPRIRDLLTEYQINSNGNVQVEIIDPLQDPEKEAEANQTYGIKPTPLQAADRYEASVINAYFDILVRYGDQNVVLNFRDLIEVQQSNSGDVEVKLRNLEYDLTRSIKKVVFGFQSIDAVLASMQDPVNLTLYYTSKSMPGQLAPAPDTISKVANEIADKSNGKFTFKKVDLEDPTSGMTAADLEQQYGLRPIPIGLFSQEGYYLHMILQIGEEQPQLLYPSGDLSEADIRTTIESALKRASSGFLKVVGVWTPPDNPQPDQFGQQAPSLKQFTQVTQQLRKDYTVKNVDLTQGQVPNDVDVLLVIAPQAMSDIERYAIDQYLMRGGSVIVSAGNYILSPAQMMAGGLAVEQIQGGMQEMLASYGITVENQLVLDSQNEPFPQQVVRNVNGVQIQGMQAVDYPFFVDVRNNGMDKQNPMLANLPAVTLNWASPLTIDEAKNSGRKVDILLKSSDKSWVQNDTNIQPNLEVYPDTGFAPGTDLKSHPLAVAVQGSFESFFKGKEMPQAQPSADPNQPPPAPVTSTVGTIDRSPENARLVVIGSAEFLNDLVFNLSSNLSRDRYLNSLQFAQNTVDWSVEDLDLLTIRSRGTASRVLNPDVTEQGRWWEWANYGIAVLAVVALGFVWNFRQRNETPMVLLPAKDFHKA